MSNISLVTSSLLNIKNICDSIDSDSVISQIEWLITECQERMMTDAVKWAAEILAFLPLSWGPGDMCISPSASSSSPAKSVASRTKAGFRATTINRKVLLGKSLFHTKEFARATFFLSDVKRENAVTKFLYFWGRYLMCIKNKLENESEAIDHTITAAGSENKDTHDFSELLQDLYEDYEDSSQQGLYDAFMFYLMAKIENSVGNNKKAFETMKRAIKMEPRLWAAWEEIVDLLQEPTDIQGVADLAKINATTWMPDWFTSLALKRFNYDRNATDKIEQLINRGFPEVPMIISHKAAMADRMLEHERAIELFQNLHELDPLRIEEMNLYCDSLFCMSERTALTSLTHSFYKTHKFEWQTAYIVGNYYTIRGEHEQAVRFFQRALRLNPNQASIWVVIGHEFVELKNNSAACLAYRKALEIDNKEYRAWYGLGQLYDILKMSSYALYYYQEAHKCRPVDSRILVALGLIYQRMEKWREALKCFNMAHKNGDVEGTALWHMAKMFEKEQLMDNAARTYEEYLKALDMVQIVNDNIPYIVQFLAKHFCQKGEWDKAKTYAQRCLGYEAIAEEGRKILRDVTDQEEQRIVNVSSVTDVSADMQISDGEGDISYDD